MQDKFDIIVENAQQWWHQHQNWGGGQKSVIYMLKLAVWFKNMEFFYSTILILTLTLTLIPYPNPNPNLNPNPNP